MSKGTKIRFFAENTLPVIVAAVVSIVALVMLFNPSYGLTSNEVDPKVLDNMSSPLGLLSEKQSLENAGELRFEYGTLNKEEILTGDDPAVVYIGKDEISKGLVYIKIVGANESKLRVLLVPKDSEFDGTSMRPYGEGYYPLTHGPGEYLFVVLGKQNDDVYKEVFRTNFIAKFEADEPYKYSNVFSKYSYESELAKKAYELTYKLDGRDAKAKRVKNYLSRNYRYAYGSEGAHELVDNDESYERGEGVCYHYASLYSSMMKSIGIPTREVRGFLNGDDAKYHAWNEYLNDENEWVLIDSTGVVQESGYEYIKTEFSER